MTHDAQIPDTISCGTLFLTLIAPSPKNFVLTLQHELEMLSGHAWWPPATPLHALLKYFVKRSTSRSTAGCVMFTNSLRRGSSGKWWPSQKIINGMAVGLGHRRLWRSLALVCGKRLGLSPDQRAPVRSQSGPLASVPFTALPVHRVQMLLRLRLPLPFTDCTCGCGRPLDAFGHHRGACSTVGCYLQREMPSRRFAEREGPGSPRR